MLEAGVPPRAAKPLALEGVTLAQIQQLGVGWAAEILLEKQVVLSQRELQQVSIVAAEAAHINVPPRLQAPPQLHGARERCGPAGAAAAAGGEALVFRRVRDARVQVLQGVVERGAQPEVLQKVRARAPQCSQQFGGGPNHGVPSVVPASWTAEPMPKTKAKLVDTLHVQGITATRDHLMRSSLAELARPLTARRRHDSGTV